MKQNIFRMLALILVLVFASPLLMAQTVPVSETALRLQTRSRTPYVYQAPEDIKKDPFPFKGWEGYDFQILHQSVYWEPTATAVCVVDFEQSSKVDSLRALQTELLPRVAEFLNAAGQKGIATCYVESDLPIKESKKNSSSVGGRTNRVPLSQDEALAWLKEHKITQVILVDLSLQKAIGPGHRFGTTFLKEAGIDSLFVRDLTAVDDMVSGEQLIYSSLDDRIAYLERHCCPTIVSSSLTNKPAFRFCGDQRRHVTFIVSDAHYHAEKILPLFAHYLTEQNGLYCTVITGEGSSAFYNDVEIDTADAAVVYFRRLPIPAEMKVRLEHHLDQGKGLLGLRTSSHAFAPKGNIPAGFVTWPEFDKDVQGGNYDDHGPNELGTDVANLLEQADHPILKGVSPEQWHSVGSLYYTKPLTSDAIVLQTGSNPVFSRSGGVITLSEEIRTEPLTWIRPYGPNKARIAYSAMGHPDDFNVSAARTVFVNLVLWCIEKGE